MPVRDQGENRPTCLAFAASSAHEYVREMDEYLSVEYLYFAASRDSITDTSPNGLTLDSVRTTLKDEGQPLESVWPYDTQGSKYWCAPLNLGQMRHCRLEYHNNPVDIVVSITNYVPVILAIDITETWFSKLCPFYLIDCDREQSPKKGSISHAVLVVGLGEGESRDPTLLIQNSWGTRWADNGFAWLSWNYVKHHFLGCLTIAEVF